MNRQGNFSAMFLCDNYLFALFHVCFCADVIKFFSTLDNCTYKQVDAPDLLISVISTIHNLDYPLSRLSTISTIHNLDYPQSRLSTISTIHNLDYPLFQLSAISKFPFLFLIFLFSTLCSLFN